MGTLQSMLSATDVKALSKKETQSAAASSFTGCAGGVESSDAAVLAVLGSLCSAPKQAHPAGFARLHVPLRRLEAGLLTLSCTCCSQPLPRLCPTAPPRVRWDSPFAVWRGGKRKWLCVVFTSAHKKDISGPNALLGGKSWCWCLQVPAPASEGLGAAPSSDFRVTEAKFLLLSVAPSLAFLSTPLSPPKYSMEVTTP